MYFRVFRIVVIFRRFFLKLKALTLCFYFNYSNIIWYNTTECARNIGFSSLKICNWYRSFIIEITHNLTENISQLITFRGRVRVMLCYDHTVTHQG